MSSENLVRIFENGWEKISGHFPESLREEIKEKTKKELQNLGRCKILQMRETKSIIATKLYDIQKTVISSRIVKPKTAKEIADIFDINPGTISNRHKRQKRLCLET